jgi:hypothetical protein
MPRCECVGVFQTVQTGGDLQPVETHCAYSESPYTAETEGEASNADGIDEFPLNALTTPRAANHPEIPPDRNFACFRNTFTEEQYRRYEKSFWALPASFGDSSSSLLSQLWKDGGIGAISIVPVLGMFAGSSFHDHVAMSAQELARLGDVCAQSVARARPTLQRLGLATAKEGMRRGKKLLIWNLSRSLIPERKGDRFVKEYFFFPMRLIHGRNWARMNPTQRVVYLGAATRAFSWCEADAKERLPDMVHEPELLAPFFAEHATAPIPSGSTRPEVRLAVVSTTDLTVATGLSRSGVQTAVRQFRMSMQSDPRSLHCPLMVLPSRDGGSNVYLFRDGVAPWPFRTQENAQGAST